MEGEGRALLPELDAQATKAEFAPAAGFRATQLERDYRRVRWQRLHRRHADFGCRFFWLLFLWTSKEK